MSNADSERRGWRLLGEIAQPSGNQDDHWVVDGLEAELEKIEVPAPYLERVKYAAVAAVARARKHRATASARHGPLTVRVLVSIAAAGCAVSRGWGFFVVERATSEIDGTSGAVEGDDGRPAGPCIDLYLYTDAGST